MSNSNPMVLREKILTTRFSTFLSVARWFFRASCRPAFEEYQRGLSEAHEAVQYEYLYLGESFGPV